MKWGTGITSYVSAADGTSSVSVTSGNTVTDAELDNLLGTGEGQTKRNGDAVANAITLSNTSAAFKAVTADGNVELNLTSGGYYVIVDSATSGTSSSTTNDAFSKLIVQVVGNVKVTPKSDYPTVDKKVLDGTTWKDAVAAGSSDTVEYMLVGTLPTNFADYKTYKTFTFTDTLSKGLTPTETAVQGAAALGNYHIYVYTGSSDVDSLAPTAFTADNGFTEITEANPVIFGSEVHHDTSTDQYTITVRLASNVDLKTATYGTGNTKFAAGNKIVVTYTAKLNANATIGTNGNDNKVKLTYSNDPKVEHTGDTEEEKVTTFTLKLQPTKHIGSISGTGLEGAGFTVYKATKAEDGTYTKANPEVVLGKGTSDANGKVTFYLVGSNGEIPETNAEEMKLADGDYILSETTVPPSYNKMDDVGFTVDTTINDTEQTLTNATITSDADTDDAKAFSVALSGNDNGVIKVDLVNESGATLPSTGGIGTTIFYVIGGVLIAGAAVLLIMRKRKA